MDYEHWKQLTPWQRAKWPASDKGYRRPQDQVAINIDPDLTEWLLGPSSGGRLSQAILRKPSRRS